MSKKLDRNCGYQGHEFGATYPDSVCFNGQLFHADDCDDRGNLFEPLEHIPCPECNHAAWLEYWRESIENEGTVAANKGLPKYSCRFIEANLKYPQDRDCLIAMWQKGYDEMKSELLARKGYSPLAEHVEKSRLPRRAGSGCID
jgi:hypothetical protein